MKDSRNGSYERLLHIQKAILEIELFTHNKNINSFLNDQLLASAVLFQYSVIGEAVIHIETSLLEKYDYPWYKVRALRNLISHEYFQIKLEAVWNIIVNDLPGLKKEINDILRIEY